MRHWPRLLHFGPLVAAVGVALAAPASAAPAPMVDQGRAADWLFAFKLNAGKFRTSPVPPPCIFGGSPKAYAAGQRYLVAYSGSPALAEGPGLIGTGTSDPVGATFAKIYASGLNFVVWNDQFYRHPPIRGCSESCASPWGHSKGIIAWDALGQGVAMQVTTPSWPGSGTAAAPRVDDGNTLGCVEDNDVKASQHFFAVRLSPADTAALLDALANASVATDIANPQLARIGGPDSIRERAARLGKKSTSTELLDVTLSTGVRLISKPSALHVPPWQMLSARLGRVPLRVATWWANPKIGTTAGRGLPGCWRADLGRPGRVAIATSGSWRGTPFNLAGGPQPDANHAKIGVSTDDHHFVVFADLNQQGALAGKCSSSQNGRGGLFFVVDDAALHRSVQELIRGGTAPAAVARSPVRRPRPR